MKKSLPLSILIATGLLIGGGVAFADIAQNADSSVSTPNTTALGASISGNIAAKGQRLGTGLSGTAASTSIYLSDSGGLGAINPGITIECYDDSGYTTYNAGCSLGATATGAENGAPKTLKTVSTVLTFNSSKYYRLGVGCISSCSGGTNPNLITYGSAGQEYLLGDFSSSMNIVDLYFVITGGGGGPSSPSYLAFTSPTSGQNLDDFATWGLEYAYSTSTPLGGGTGSSTIVVYYSKTSSSTAAYSDSDTAYQVTTDMQTAAVPKGRSLIQIPETNGQSWWTWAKLFDFYGNQAAVTTPFQFTVDFPTGQDFTSASSTADLATTCDTGSGAFANSLCKLLQAVFYPSQQSIDNFSSLKEAMQNKPPFGYFTALSTALSDLSASSSASVDLSDLSGIGIFDDFRTLISWVLWLLFGFWIYNKFRHMKF